MRGATLWLYTVMLLGGLMTGLNAQQGDPCRRCVTVLESRISCPTDATGNLTWTLVIRNDADFAISYGFVLQTPGNVNISPNPIFFNPPLQPGETRTLTFTVSGSYLGYSELCFDMVFYNSTLDRCCRLQTCVPLPRCCFIIREEQVVCDPHTGDFIYTFMLCCNDTQSDYRHPLLKAHHTHQTRTTTKKLRCKLYTTPFANTSRRAKRNPRLRTPSPNLRLITEITVSTFQR
jgi:hypothetical protein